MRKYLILIFALVSFSFTLPEVNRESAYAIHNGIERIIRNVDPDVHCGIEIISLKNRQRVYHKNGFQLFNPASTLKLFTALAALHILGVDYRFETALYSDKGDLYLKGSGDPELSIRSLEELVFQLKLANIHSIEGNLYVDTTDFDGVSQGPGWMWDEGAYYWNSPMDALTVNHSCIDIWVRPGKDTSKPASLFLYPKTGYVTLKNLATTSEHKETLSVERDWKKKENVVYVRGMIPMGQEPQKFSVSIEEPHLYAGAIVADFLKSQGIAFKGSVREGVVPELATKLSSVNSRPLSHIVEAMMKTSDNLAADCLFKKVGQIKYGKPGTWHKGSKAVREFLAKEVGIDVEKLVVVDGSGLSRYNLVSPHHFVESLAWAHEQFAFFSEFSASLPISGTDGTLKQRMNDERTRGRVRAKTGGMTGVCALSGYLTTEDQEVLAFTIMLNGFTQSTAEFKQKIEDEICAFLVRFSREE